MDVVHGGGVCPEVAINRTGSLATAYLNRIATAVPAHDVHRAFERHARGMLAGDPRKARLFERMVQRSGIDHRYSCLSPDNLSPGGFYPSGRFPDTGARMRAFEQSAPTLACAAVDRLLGNAERRSITHLLTTCCTGFSAPGLDHDVIDRCGLARGVERTMIGFMGCFAAINALRLARHIVRSEPDARVLMINIELCTLHLQETTDLEQMLSFLIFADGCTAALITGDCDGVALDGFRTLLIPQTRDLITWTIRDFGFDMVLSGRVPTAIQNGLHAQADELVGGVPAQAMDVWAVHPGGRTVLDAVERAFDLDGEALAASRDVLRDYGNMSSATVMFVLDALMRRGTHGAKGCAMSFGPGLSAEIMAFRGA